MPWIDYGVARPVPNKALMYVLTNEQINLIANLVVGTNDVFSFQIPYPFYIDQRTEAVIAHRMDFYLRAQANFSGNSGNRNRLLINLQYSDREPAVDWNSAGEDAEDENIQAMFDGPFLVGFKSNVPIGATNITPIPIEVDDVQNVHYYPPDRDGLDMFFPVTIVLVNASSSTDVADLAVDTADFAGIEQFGMRIYFTTRKLTQQERDMMTSEYYGLVPFS